MATTLTEATNEELLAELRRRPGLYLSVWTAEDALAAIGEDDDDVEDMDEGLKADLAEKLLADAADGMDDALGQRGNDYLTDRWTANREVLLAQVATDAPKP